MPKPPSSPPGRIARSGSGDGWVLAPFILLGSGIIQYIGASIAVGLFAVAAVGAVAWGRVFVGAVALLAWRRPRINITSKSGWRALGGPAIYGLSLITMNVIFYYALARLPLGATVALEFLGPVLLAALTSRGWRVRIGIVLAVIGVFLISWVGVDVREPGVLLGVVLAVLAGVVWAIYMWVGRKLAVTGMGIDSLAIGMGIGAIIYIPLAIPDAGVLVSDWKLVGMIIAVGLLSSALPYVLDSVIMRRIPAGTFALLNSLLPATSLVVGVILLDQIPTGGEVAGLLCITAAVALATYPGKRGA